jgi:predicted AAA+ superfamily ATPase
VVVLTGARQVGKSTLLRHAEPFRRWRYHTLDTFDVRERVAGDPRSLWAGVRQVVLDEVQKAPELLLAVKQAVDEDRSLRFVLSGSANLLLMRQVSESLAGRAVYFVLEPMTLGEMEDATSPNLLARALAGKWPEEGALAPPPDAAPLVLRGFLPALLAFNEREEWLRWWEGYVATYLERDLREMSQVDSLVDFRRVMQLLALRSGQLLNQTEVGRDARLSQPTIHRYLNLLEATHLFQRLPAYTASRTTRLLKAPRAFWTDPGLAAFLSGIHDEASLRAGRHFGPLFETLVYQHLRSLCSLLTPQARLYTWRTRRGEEVDFVVEHGQRVLAVEAKLATEVSFRLTAGLRAFLAEVPDAVGGLLVYAGNRVVRLAETLVAVPWTVLAGGRMEASVG